MRIPTCREPTHPGEMLLEEFLNPMEMSQDNLAIAIRVPYPIINDIINKKRDITPNIALRLAKFFGVSEDFWINLQLRWDLYHAKQSEKVELQLIKPFQFQKLPSVHPASISMPLT
jgi:addiction module HigA family antidote